jgi:hypothetical protein
MAKRKPIVTITVETTPDTEGKQRFVVDWIDPEGRARGQYFRANLAEQKQHWRDRGYRVRLRKLG